MRAQGTCPQLSTIAYDCRLFPLESAPKTPQKCTIVDDCAQIAESGLKPPFESPPFRLSRPNQPEKLPNRPGFALLHPPPLLLFWVALLETSPFASDSSIAGTSRILWGLEQGRHIRVSIAGPRPYPVLPFLDSLDFLG